MSYFIAGAAGVTAVGTYLSSASAARTQARNTGYQLTAQSEAEAKQITAERLNRTIANSYQTAFAQMQLALQKRQAATQLSQATAAGVAARGAAEAAAAATGSIGASTDAVISDINNKVDTAKAQVLDNYATQVDNYNNNLEMMVVNTNASAPVVNDYSRVKYAGPSTGELVGGAILSGLVSFASSYAMQKMKLGLGETGSAPQAGVSQTVYGYANLSGVSFN